MDGKGGLTDDWLQILETSTLAHLLQSTSTLAPSSDNGHLQITIVLALQPCLDKRFQRFNSLALVTLKLILSVACDIVRATQSNFAGMQPS